MATWDDVRRIARALPETAEVAGETSQWRVGDKLFIWERPLRASDLAALGLAEQPGRVLAARVEHEGAKDALITENPAIFFTTPHFNGYPAILVRLDDISAAQLQELIVEAWLCRAPKRIATAYLKSMS